MRFNLGMTKTFLLNSVLQNSAIFYHNVYSTKPVQILKYVKDLLINISQLSSNSSCNYEVVIQVVRSYIDVAPGKHLRAQTGMNQGVHRCFAHSLRAVFNCTSVA